MRFYRFLTIEFYPLKKIINILLFYLIYLFMQIQRIGYSQEFYYFFPFITIIVAVIYHPVILMDSLLLEIILTQIN